MKQEVSASGQKWIPLGNKTGKTAINYDLSQYEELLVVIYIPSPVGAYASMVIPKDRLSNSQTTVTPWGGVFIRASLTQAIIYMVSVNNQDISGSSILYVYGR